MGLRADIPHNVTVRFPNDTSNVTVRGCGRMIVDINGNEEPNTIGVDIFNLTFSEDGLAWDAEPIEE